MATKEGISQPSTSPSCIPISSAYSWTSQAIDRLFGGDADAWSTFDPATAIPRHAAYGGVSGHGATTLCLPGRSRGLGCSVVSHPGRHTWPFARTAFANTLPWLTERLRRPGR
ncbi:hypothetical protein [Mycobacterium sp. URHB0021]